MALGEHEDRRSTWSPEGGYAIAESQVNGERGVVCTGVAWRARTTCTLVPHSCGSFEIGIFHKTSLLMSPECGLHRRRVLDLPSDRRPE